MKKIVVLAKQVPDTANVTGDAMKPDGTVNRAALPAIFNPEDLNALEMGLTIGERLGMEVHVVTMGPPKAVEILKHARYMGAHHVWLVTDRRFAAADTLATSKVLAKAIEKLGDVDLVLAGRQAIDGDTAQVGPQVAEKLDFNQVTYVNGLEEFDENGITVERDGETRTEVIRTGFPVLLTVTGTANEPRYPNAVNMLKGFRAVIATELDEDQRAAEVAAGNAIPVLTLDDLDLPVEECGLSGSPTKVHKIKSITLTGTDLQLFNPEKTGIQELVRNIMKDYVEVDR